MYEKYQDIIRQKTHIYLKGVIMEFTLQLKLGSSKNAEFLIRAFYEDYNPKSSIKIQRNIATVKAHFEEVPDHILSTIGYNELIFFRSEGSMVECRETGKLQLKLKGSKNAEFLIRAFYEDKNPKSRIEIQENIATVNAHFELPSDHIFSTIGYNELIEFCSESSIDECKETENSAVAIVKGTDECDVNVAEEPEECGTKESDLDVTEGPKEFDTEESDVDDPEEPKECDTEESDVDDPEEPKESDTEESDVDVTEEPEECDTEESDVDVTEKPEECDAEESDLDVANELKEGVAKQSKHEDIGIPEIQSILESSNSFCQFLEHIAQFLSLGRRAEYFKRIVQIATECEDKLSWKYINKRLTELGYPPTPSQTEKIYCSSAITEKLGKKVKILKFVRKLASYKDYEFCPKQVNLNCMSGIPEFGKILEHVDKTESITSQLLYVLEQMGLKDLPEEKQAIIVLVATKIPTSQELKDMNQLLDEIPDKTLARITFSEFINNYITRFDKNKFVNFWQFSSELYEFLKQEDEMKS